MQGQLCEILSRHKELSLDPARPTNFEVSPGKTAGPSIVATSRDWSLYCLDPDKRIAWFVEMPTGFDLGSVPFSFMAQFEHAKRVMLVPFGDLRELAEMAPFTENPIFIFSIGRCGSTLLSKIFAQMPDVWSISEPDAFTGLVQDRHHYDDDLADELHWAAMRLYFRPPAGREKDVFVAKFRSQSSFGTAPFLRAFPDARALFLYREPQGWVNSFFRMMQNFGLSVTPGPFDDLKLRWDRLTVNSPTNLLERVCDISRDAINLEEVMAAIWLVNMEQFHLDGALDPAFQPLSYRELNEERERSVCMLLDMCGLPQSCRVDAMKAYSMDSQKGTIASSNTGSVSMTTQQLATVKELLNDYDHLGLPRVR